MFHIVFNANDNYIEYLSVLCYSIVENTTTNNGGGEGRQYLVSSYKSIESNETNDFNIENDNDLELQNNGKYQASQQNTGTNNINKTPFHFHILTDGISQATKGKLKDFEKELNKIYPCQFSIYLLSDSDFKGLPKLNGNYLTYFRLKMASYLPQDITTCLYLDVDMLCISDIRGIFDIDLKDKICAVVLDADYQSSRIMESRHNKSGFALNLNTYFNAGLMLISLAQWRKENIEKQCFEWLSQYIPKWHDQDTLNAVLSDRVLLLRLEWNFMVGHIENRIKSDFKGDDKYSIAYTYEEYLRAKEHIKILHYLTDRKPWHSSDANGRVVEYPYRGLWWKAAFKTFIFCKDLQILYTQLQEQTLTNCINLQAEVLTKHTKEIYYLRRLHKLIFRSIKSLLRRLREKYAHS